MNAIGEAVRAMRAERGWSQDDLVGRSHVSKGTIQNLETGRFNPRQDTLRKIAGAFGVTAHDLLIAAAEWGEDPLPPE